MISSLTLAITVIFLSLAHSHPVDLNEESSLPELLVIDWTKVKIGYLVPDDLDDYLREIGKDLQFTPPETEIEGLSGVLPYQVSHVPYQAGLALIDASGVRWWCGGALISSQLILTAAHCLDGADSALVFLGAYNIQAQHEPDRIEISVSKRNFIIHEEWNRQDMLNDIALIKLPVAISYSEAIRPIQLPVGTEEVNNLEDKVVVSGWNRCI